MRVSVIIKALNEERNIARAIESALAAVERAGGGEVILADSLSTDRTVEIAKRYPVRIVQLADRSNRSCGAGAELGYRVARARFIYILDADMELDGGFLVEAMATLDANPALAGVGGLIQEMEIANAEFRRRAANGVKPGEVDRLNGGGLFRKSAVDGLGYLTNHTLHSLEEYELGLRLRTAGWRLLRLNRCAVRHYGHSDATFRLLWRRWRSRSLWGGGELLRECMGKPYFREAVRGVRQYRLFLIVAGWWLALSITLIGGFFVGMLWLFFVLTLITPLMVGLLSKDSPTDTVYKVLLQNIASAGIIAGFFARRRGNPFKPPPFSEVK